MRREPASGVRFRRPAWSDRRVRTSIQKPIHVADRLHRAAEAVEEARGAGHEALPAIATRLAGAEAEIRSCGERLLGAQGRVVALILGVVGNARSGTSSPERRHREGVCEASSGLIAFTVLPSTARFHRSCPEPETGTVAQAACAVTVARPRPWWENVNRDRGDLPRVLPEFDLLGVYEVDDGFTPPKTPDGITGHHFRRTPRPGQGVLTGNPTIGLSLVLISPKDPARAGAA